MTSVSQLTREDYLIEASEMILADIIYPHLTTEEQPRHDYQVSMSRPLPANAVAEYWIKKDIGTDDPSQIFMTATIDDTPRILSSLAHELIHYCDNGQSGHRHFFARVARQIGLEGKLTATTASEQLAKQLHGIAQTLGGDIPHKKLVVSATKPPKKKQRTKMLKVECPICLFSFRTTRVHIAKLDTSSRCPACDSDNLRIEQIKEPQE